MESIGHRGGLIARSAAIFRIISILIVIIIDKDKNVLADGGTVTKPTVGAVWPKPFSQNSHPTYLALQPHVFKFKSDKYDCDIIDEAVRRYYNLIFLHFGTTYDSVRLNRHTNPTEPWNFAGYLDMLEIYLMSKCETFPYEYMDEHYELHINSGGYERTGILIAQSVWGILRGLETFSQLIRPVDVYQFAIQSTSIQDFPRFTHRGLLIDTSRHYLPSLVIMKIIDAMAYSKLNVFHWHIVDDQSFPYQSVKFPSLSENGSYDPYYAVYSQSDIKRIVNHGRLRGIRVIAEFDTPGHTLSWGRGLAGFLTPCNNYYYGDNFGPVDPSRDENYQIIEKLFQEVKTLFPDEYLHIGGDEVDFTCWASNPAINKFMKSHGIVGLKQLEEYYIQKILDINSRLGVKSIVWQEVFDNGVRLNESTIVHIWTGSQQDELYQVTGSGYKALLSSCWYLDHLNTGGDWLKYYECDPLNFPGTKSQKRLVLGGEACMWGEVVDETNVQQRIWPRACATAEVLWSGISNITYAESRLEEHVCRLKKRGIPAQPPNGPNFCPYTLL